MNADGQYFNRAELIKIFDFKKDGSLFEDLTLVGQLGFVMVGSIGLGLLIGYYLDKWLGTKGLFITIFILLGIAGGGYKVYLEIMEVTEKGRGENKDGEQSE